MTCGKAGIGCSPPARHPFKDTGPGTLHSCRTALPTACSYLFPNGEKCAFMNAAWIHADLRILPRLNGPPTECAAAFISERLDL